VSLTESEGESGGRLWVGHQKMESLTGSRENGRKDFNKGGVELVRLAGERKR
jgi:hypothetical protein